MATRRSKRVQRVTLKDPNDIESPIIRDNPTLTNTKVESETCDYFRPPEHINTDTAEDEICVLCFKYKTFRLSNYEYQWLRLIPVLCRLLAVPTNFLDPLTGLWICKDCELRILDMEAVLKNIEELQLHLEKLKTELHSNLQSTGEELLSENAGSEFSKAVIFRQEIRKVASVSASVRCHPSSTQQSVAQTISVQGELKVDSIGDYEPPPETLEHDSLESQIEVSTFAPITDDLNDVLQVEEIVELPLEATAVNVQKSVTRNSQTSCDFCDPITKKSVANINEPRKLEAHRRSHQLTIKLRDEFTPADERVDVSICPVPQCGRKRILHQHFANHMLLRHLKLVCNHSVSSKGREAICEEFFDTSEQLENHRDCHCPSIACVIPYCDQELNITRFKEHVLETHQLISCYFRKEDGSRCLQVFGTAEEVEEHTKLDHYLIEVQPQIVKEVVNPELNRDRLSCGICGSKFLKNSEFAFHVSCHGYYVCLETSEGSRRCFSYFATRDLLAAHLESNHPIFTLEDSREKSRIAWRFKKPLGVCRMCGKTGLIEWDQLRNHLSLHGSYLCLGEDRITGKKCRKYYKTAEQLTAHSLRCSLFTPRSTVEASDSFFCTYCQRTMRVNGRETVEDHIKDHNAFICDYMDKKTQELCYHTELSEIFMQCHQDRNHFNADSDADNFSVSSEPSYESKEELLRFADVNTETCNSAAPEKRLVNNIACEYCEKEFPLQDQEWEKHIRSHGRFVCGIIFPETNRPCHKICDNIFQLAQHSRRNHAQVKPASAPYKCKRCTFTSQVPSKFKAHTCRREIFETPFICEQCGKSYCTPKALREHKAMVHGGALKFSCDECGKGFQLSRLLIYHKRSFHGTGIIVCEICGFPCTTYSIRAHLSSHNEPTVECTVCGKMFSSKQSCSIHYKNSHAERKFACPDCPWRFSRNAMLLKHIRRVHTGLRPYSCDICDASFKTGSHRKDHMKKHEKGLIGENAKFRPIARRVKTPPPDVYNPAFVPKLQ